MKTDQRNRPESPETDLHKYSQLHLTKEQRQFKGEKTASTSTSGKVRFPYATRLRPYTFYKNNSK